MSALEPRSAYRLWASGYAAETAVSFLDEDLARALSPSPQGLRLLDAGCGVGRRLPQGAALAVGIDVSPEMLAAGDKRTVAAADVRALPFVDRSFDLVWCRLVLGHIGDPAPAYREMARVCRVGGHLLVSDIHADSIAAGHKRNFCDQDGQWREIEHHVHDRPAHVAMAGSAGFRIEAQRDGVVGPSIESFFRNAGRMAAYERDQGLALVAGLLFQRTD